MKTKKTRHVFVYFLISILVSPRAVAEADLVQVGFIDCFDGSPGQYSLLRNGKTVPIGPYTPVFAGDRISAHDDLMEMRLIVDGEPLMATRRNSPLVLKAAGRAPTVLGNLYAWAGQYFTSLHSDMRQAHLISTISRGGYSDRIDSALLSFEPLVLMPGKRELFLAWEGGTAPYRMTLSANATVIGESQNLETPRVRMKALALVPGNYRIVIGDANERTFETSLTVRPADIAAPASLETLSLPGEIKATLLAAWLAGRNEGYWRFEAYQRVAPYSDGYSNAQLLTDALERGVDAPYFTAD